MSSYRSVVTELFLISYWKEQPAMSNIINFLISLFSILNAALLPATRIDWLLIEAEILLILPVFKLYTA